MLDIVNNGSQWAGQPPAPIERLYEVLENYTLDYHFNHISRIGEIYQFRGNFRLLTHVFNIYTDDPVIIKKMRILFCKNKRRKEYQKQKPEKQNGKM
jgi:hypothetical protein